MLETANQRFTTIEATVTPDVIGPDRSSLDADPLRCLYTTSEPEIDDLIETLIAWTHNIVGPDKIVEARERFFAETGKVFTDDSVYEARMSYFFDRLLFERPLGDATGAASKTPYELFKVQLESLAEPLPEGVRERISDLGDYRHSLFRITKASGGSLVVQDLRDRVRLCVTPRPGENFKVLDRSALFQGFIFRIGGQHRLSPGLVFHPPRATRVLRRQLNLAQKSEHFSMMSFLSRTANLHVRHLRHRHVDPKVIYTLPPATERQS